MPIFKIESGDAIVGHYQLTQFPGCRGVFISHGLEIFKQYRGMGHATKAHPERFAQAIKLGAHLLLATIDVNNKQQIHLMRKFHWKICKEFTHMKTGNNIVLYCKNLTDPYAETSNGIGV